MIIKGQPLPQSMECDFPTRATAGDRGLGFHCTALDWQPISGKAVDEASILESLNRTVDPPGAAFSKEKRIPFYPVDSSMNCTINLGVQKVHFAVASNPEQGIGGSHLLQRRKVDQVSVNTEDVHCVNAHGVAVARHVTRVRYVTKALTEASDSYNGVVKGCAGLRLA